MMLRERFWTFCRRQSRSAVLSIGFGAVFSMIFSIGSHTDVSLSTRGVGAYGVASDLHCLLRRVSNRFDGCRTLPPGCTRSLVSDRRFHGVAAS